MSPLWPHDFLVCCLISPYLPVPQDLAGVKEPLLLELTSGVQQAPGEMSGAGGSGGSPEGSVEGPEGTGGAPEGSVDQNQGLEDRQ